ncbi:MAG: hypothetical protein M3154_04280 [Candidatus Eremiobacteraeota bacterium]|nr:hypothetical protein [Candidatus Eremiobacteraeota bacterium]
MRLARVPTMRLPPVGRVAALIAGLCPVLAIAPAVGCAPRTVQVSNGPEPAAAGLSFKNGLSTAVNVYVRGPSGNEVFVRQVPAGTSEALVMQGIAPGAHVSLRAAPVNGASGYTRDDVVLGNGASWTVP